MIGFPGRIFDGEGSPTDGGGEGLTAAVLSDCLYRSAVQMHGGGLSEVAVIWLLEDVAQFGDISQQALAGALRAVLAGHAVMILARRLEVGADVHSGLLDRLGVALSLPDVGGRA